jgi:hypothetical protein
VFSLNPAKLAQNGQIVRDRQAGASEGGEGSQRLSLVGVSITDQGLEHLEKLRLTSLWIGDNPQVTDAGVAKLGRAMPKCKIHRERHCKAPSRGKRQDPSPG